MTINKYIATRGFIILLVIGVWLVGFATLAGAETMKYKIYTYVVKSENVLIGDVEGHAVSLIIRRAILEFENGETATNIIITTGDRIKGSGPILVYSTIIFTDGSTIIIKSQGTTAGGTAVGVITRTEATGEIIKGTGRFEGIKGTETKRFKYFPVEKGEDGPKGIGEGTMNYTLPSK
jgi:hypothetical protein